jgi:hypothetical protein
MERMRFAEVGFTSELNPFRRNLKLGFEQKDLKRND